MLFILCCLRFVFAKERRKSYIKSLRENRCSIQTALEAAAQRICESRQIHGVKGERAFRRALSGLQKTKQGEWRLFYEGLKIMRNECAHVSLSNLHPNSLKKLKDAGFSYLLSDGKISINCQKYLPVAKRATECILALQESESAINK
jgi:hypothetical protein